MTCKRCIDSCLFFITLAHFGVNLKTATKLLILCLKNPKLRKGYLPPWKMGLLCLAKDEDFESTPRCYQSSKFTRENSIKNHGKIPKIFFIEFKNKSVLTVGQVSVSVIAINWLHIFYHQQIEKPFNIWTWQDVYDFLAEKPVSNLL